MLMDLYLSLLLPRRQNPLAGRIRATTARASCCCGGEERCSAAVQLSALLLCCSAMGNTNANANCGQIQVFQKILPSKYKIRLQIRTLLNIYLLCCSLPPLLWLLWPLELENRFSSGAPPVRPRISHIIDVTTHCGQCHNIDFTAAAVNCMIL